MYKADVAIVGAGLGGLIAGATLAKQGRSVFLLDKHYVPGGCATTFKRRDFVMEVGLHSMDGLDDDDMKKAAFDFLDVEKNLDFIPLPEFHRLLTPNIDCTVPTGVETAITELSARYPEEEKALKAFFALIVGLRKDVGQLPVQKWKFMLQLPVFPLLYPKLVRYSQSTLGQYLDSRFQSDELKLILSANLPYYHDNPYTMSLLFFALAQASYFKGGAYYIRGGSQKLSDYLASIIVDHGGVVMLAKEVTEITIENGAVSGFRFRDAFNQHAPVEQISARDVIVNAPLPLVPNLLPKKQADKLRKSLSTKETACSLLSVYVGFNADIGDFGSNGHSTLIADEPLHDLQDFKENLANGDFEKCGMAFVDYSRVDSGLTPVGKSFASLSIVANTADWKGLDPEVYAAKKEAVAQILFDRLDKCYPGIKGAVESYEVSTPETITRYTSNPSGSAYGYAQIPSQAGLRRPSRTSSIKGLRFASAWVAPGGGQSGALISGYLASKELQLARGDMTVSTPLTIRDSRRVRLLERRTIAERTFELVFEKPEFFNPMPGQNAIVELEPIEEFTADMAVRPLSISSSNDEDVVRFAMRVSGSSYKKHCLSMKVGDCATIYGPVGDFLLPEDSVPIAFIIGGVGITPVIPMLKSLRKQGFPELVTLLYSDKNPQAMAYRTQLEAIEEKNFQFCPVFTGSQKRIDSSLLSDTFSDYARTEFFLVGTRGFLDDMGEALNSIGVAPSRIHKDDFG